MAGPRRCVATHWQAMSRPAGHPDDESRSVLQRTDWRGITGNKMSETKQERDMQDGMISMIGKAGVWIDHRRALIVLMTPRGEANESSSRRSKSS